MANVAERKNEVSTSNSTSNYPQVIVVHFIKNKYDLPMPVGIANFDVPLIELVKEVKSSNKYFFYFNKDSVESIKKKTAEIIVCCKEAKLEISIQNLKAELNKFTVRALYDMSDTKTNHHSISFIVRDIPKIDEGDTLVDIDI